MPKQYLLTIRVTIDDEHEPMTEAAVKELIEQELINGLTSETMEFVDERIEEVVVEALTEMP